MQVYVPVTAFLTHKCYEVHGWYFLHFCFLLKYFFFKGEQVLRRVISPPKKQKFSVKKTLVVNLQLFSLIEDIWVLRNSLLYEFFICSTATIICIIMKSYYWLKKWSNVGLFTTHEQSYTMVLPAVTATAVELDICLTLCLRRQQWVVTLGLARREAHPLPAPRGSAELLFLGQAFLSGFDPRPAGLPASQ